MLMRLHGYGREHRLPHSKIPKFLKIFNLPFIPGRKAPSFSTVRYVFRWVICLISLFLRRVTWLCANGQTNVSLGMNLSLFMRTISLTLSKTVISMEKLAIPHDRYLALTGISGSVLIKRTLIGGKMRILLSMIATQQERLKKKLAH